MLEGTKGTEKLVTRLMEEALQELEAAINMELTVG